jgi:hypothetical protein
MTRKVHSLEGFNDNCLCDSDDNFRYYGEKDSFVPQMIKYCSKEIEIIKDDIFERWHFIEWMLEPIVEDPSVYDILKELSKLRKEKCIISGILECQEKILEISKSKDSKNEVF